MRRRVYSGYVAFTLTPAERARLTRVAQSCGYAHLDPLAHDLFRIGLLSLDTAFVTTTAHERFLGARPHGEDQPRSPGRTNAGGLVARRARRLA